jgi:hypothetical protein
MNAPEIACGVEISRSRSKSSTKRRHATRCARIRPPIVRSILLVIGIVAIARSRTVAAPPSEITLDRAIAMMSAASTTLDLLARSQQLAIAAVD